MYFLEIFESHETKLRDALRTSDIRRPSWSKLTAPASMDYGQWTPPLERPWAWPSGLGLEATCNAGTRLVLSLGSSCFVLPHPQSTAAHPPRLQRRTPSATGSVRKAPKRNRFFPERAKRKRASSGRTEALQPLLPLPIRRHCPARFGAN